MVLGERLTYRARQNATNADPNQPPKRHIPSVPFAPHRASLFTASSGQSPTCSGELCIFFIFRHKTLLAHTNRKLYGEDDEAGDDDELNKAQADGENGELILPSRGLNGVMVELTCV